MKKRKKTVKNNQHTTREILPQTIEIDYEKLANCISDSVKKQDSSGDYSIVREWMKFLIYPVFWGISLLLFSIAAYSFVEVMRYSAIFSSTDTKALIKGMPPLMGYFILMLFSLSAGIVSIFAAKELNNEKDKQFVASVFSNVVSLVALIVALIALLK